MQNEGSYPRSQHWNQFYRQHDNIEKVQYYKKRVNCAQWFLQLP